MANRSQTSGFFHQNWKWCLFTFLFKVPLTPMRSFREIGNGAELAISQIANKVKKFLQQGMNLATIPTPGRRQSKTLLTINEQGSLETVFLIAICLQLDDKWQSKTLFQTIFFIYVH